MDLNKFKCKKYSTVAGEGFCNGCFNETYASHLFVLFAMVTEERWKGWGKTSFNVLEYVSGSEISVERSSNPFGLHKFG